MYSSSMPSASPMYSLSVGALSSRLTQTKPPNPISVRTSRSPASALQNRFWNPCSSRVMSTQLPLVSNDHAWKMQVMRFALPTGS